MAIKPKSRAHEERIKALEWFIDIQSQINTGLSDRLTILEVQAKAKPASKRFKWQFWK